VSIEAITITRDLWPRTVPFIKLDLGEATKLAEVLPDRPKVASLFPLPGGLTNSNYRFFFEDGGSVEAKLYQSEPSPAAIERAIHRLGAERNLLMPHWLGGADDNAVSGMPYALFDWIDGSRLDLTIRDADNIAAEKIAEDVGAALARIHAVTFPSFGFFDAHLTVQGDFDLKGSGMRAYFGNVLKSDLGRMRLGADLCDALLAFAEREASVLDTWQGAPCLTHGDCGGTNILVLDAAGNYALSGFIDWEFAFAGTPFFDLGNLLRPPLGEGPGFADALARGYLREGGTLPDNWRALASITDLLTWVESALRPRVSGEYLLSAQQAIVRTIAASRCNL